jgi:hypothetical protein
MLITINDVDLENDTLTIVTKSGRTIINNINIDYLGLCTKACAGNSPEELSEISGMKSGEILEKN